MEYVFAIFMFGLMISLLVLKGVILARDLANEEFQAEGSKEKIVESGGPQATQRVG